ncbi:MAG: hypothetical protein WBW75_01675 [Mycobacterium sp.]|uniref:hypothetical protein n=1 Tax=Mycobacterium sp. TaxID=1785 RepID=UPI003C54422F
MESQTQTTQTTAAKSVANVLHNVRRLLAGINVRWLLAGTMAVESLLVIYLALRDFALAATLTATIGSVTLLAISVVGVWAAYATWLQHDSWLGASLLGQISIAVLAGYTVLADVRSPFPEFFDLDWSKKSPLIPLRVGGFACILGIFAIFWVVYLIRYWRGPITAWTKSIVALIPVLGFVQFWLQTDYLPRTSLPMVDVTTDLTPTGKTGDIVQLEAKVTINNRSSVPVNVGGTAMRITAYPRATGIRTQLPQAFQFAISPKSRPYRDDPLPSDQRIPLYAKDLLTAGSQLPPGQSNTFRKVVDFNSRTMRLARLAVDAIFITSPSIDSTYTCAPPPGVVWFHDPGGTPLPPQMSTDKPGFQDEISKVIVDNTGGQFLCREIRLKPRNVIHEIIGDNPSFEVAAIFKDPTNPWIEYPTLLLWQGANGNYSLTARQWQKVSDANPTMTYTDIAVEYSPSEESAPPVKK